MIFEVLFALSVLLNAALLFFAIRLSRRIFVVGTNLEALYGLIYSFRSHIEQVHESEVIYGDQTLQELITHSNEVINELDNYEDLMQIVEISEQENEEEE